MSLIVGWSNLESVMSHILSIQQASGQLGELVRSLHPDDEIILTDNNQPVARIVPSGPPTPRNAGAWKGKLEILDDSDEVILEHFAEYLP
jgi:antitoxin (DNA-binding transcriptional repressor) of toxin-antitoxin stability system